MEHFRMHLMEQFSSPLKLLFDQLRMTITADTLIKLLIIIAIRLCDFRSNSINLFRDRCGRGNRKISIV